MPAAEPKRELILANLKTTLAAINGAGYYWTTVKTVKRVPSVPADLEGEQKPGLLIVATGEKETIENEFSNRDRCTMAVGIIGVLNRPAADEGAAINRFMQDVRLAIMADPSRGGYATMTSLSSEIDFSNLFGDLCAFEMEIHIRYHCNAKTGQ